MPRQLAQAESRESAADESTGKGAKISPRSPPASRAMPPTSRARARSMHLHATRAGAIIPAWTAAVLAVPNPAPYCRLGLDTPRFHRPLKRGTRPRLYHAVRRSRRGTLHIPDKAVWEVYPLIWDRAEAHSTRDLASRQPHHALAHSRVSSTRLLADCSACPHAPAAWLTPLSKLGAQGQWIDVSTLLLMRLADEWPQRQQVEARHGPRSRSATQNTAKSRAIDSPHTSQKQSKTRDIDIYCHIGEEVSSRLGIAIIA